MRLWIPSVFIVAVWGWAGPDPAEAGPHDDSFRSTIGAQLDAFQQDDWNKAYSYASPTIQRIFPSPEGFGRMVTGGYEMIWRPSSVEFGEARQTSRGWAQAVRFTDRRGRDYIADYFMVMIDGVWRIDGVTLRKPDDLGV